jgi:glycosyltransferase involved in cell wall biosynthesis
MGKGEFVSVVLCSYNGEKFLEEQLASIEQQTHKNFELIICDDSSTDSTRKILHAFAAKDQRVKLVFNKANLGFNKNFEQALQLASANWIAISDQDDIWMKDKLAKLIETIKPGALLVHSYNAEFSGDDHSKLAINRSRKRFYGNKTRQLLFYNTIIGHTAAINRSLLKHALPFPLGVYYDWWLGVVASVYGKIELNDEVLVLFRQHASNSSRFFHLHSATLQKQAYFEEVTTSLNAFAQIGDLKEDDKKLLEKYQGLIKREWKKNFSFPIFLFFIKHAPDAFYFRKKTPMYFYYLKYSFQRASMKIKHWL